MTRQHRPISRTLRSERQPLVSAFSILLLSGFLIGAAATRLIDGELHDQAMIAGVFGMLAFLGLDQVRHRLRRRAEAVEQLYVEERLARHVDHCTPTAPAASTDIDDRNQAAASAGELLATG